MSPQFNFVDVNIKINVTIIFCKTIKILLFIFLLMGYLIISRKVLSLWNEISGRPNGI
jgi:hypothetical protein